MKEIQLTKGKVALVDDEDFEYLNQWKWRCLNGYAKRNDPIGNGKYKDVAMQNQIMKPPPGFVVDHADNNKLNNQKSNLRICTYSQNLANRKIFSTNTTGYKGVSIDKKCKHRKWYAQIKCKVIGYFDNPIDAARAYDAKALEMYGDFARLNFPNK